MQPPQSRPETIDELMHRANNLAGLSLGELAKMALVEVPDNFQRNKGWTGQLIEYWLGATAGSKPQQDFPELGVELKTLPIDQAGKPLETTYVCYAPLLPGPGMTWERSNVRNKLRCVLWMPVEGDRRIPIHSRRVATPFLWQPDQYELNQLKQDWLELTDLIVCGQIEQVTSRHGEALQLRPKAANGSVLTDAIGETGTRIKTRPRGFYLRKSFTQALLSRAFS